MRSDPKLPHPDRMVRLAGAAHIVEHLTGDRPHVATLYRWATRGLAGCKLRTCYAGGHRRTTEQWVRQFFADVTEAKSGERVALPPSPERENRRRRASEILDEAGI